MNTELIRRCELLVSNRKAIQNAFKWDMDAMLLAGSSFYVGLNKEADPEQLKACENIVKRKAGVFSEYRGNVKMPLLCKMAAAANPEQYFEEIDAIVKQMKGVKWIDTGYKILAVLGMLTMLDLSVETVVDEIIEADEYLKQQKGFGSFAMGDNMRRMYAALMVMDTHMPPAARSHESLVDSVLALVIAMEVCMMILMTTAICTSSN